MANLVSGSLRAKAFEGAANASQLRQFPLSRLRCELERTGCWSSWPNCQGIASSQIQLRLTDPATSQCPPGSSKQTLPMRELRSGTHIVLMPNTQRQATPLWPLTQRPAQRLEFLALSQRPASSNASRSDEGMCGLLHRSCELHTIRIGGRALGILQWWACAPKHAGFLLLDQRIQNFSGAASSREPASDDQSYYSGM